MTQALSIFRNDRNISSRTRAIVPACKTTTNSSGLIKTKSAKRNSPSGRIYLPSNSRCSFRYAFTARTTMVANITHSMIDLLSDLNMLSVWGDDKMNKREN